MEKVLDFLRDLKKNNNRDWFHTNKSYYQEAKTEFETFASQLIAEIQSFDNEIGEQDVKKCVFRIYRDVRFSKDKSPYKINMGVFIVKGGKNSGNAGYYLHVEPNASFVGGGIYMPPSDILKKIRSEIYNFTDEYKKITNNKKFISMFGEVRGEKLKMPPKGFPKDFEEIDMLKLKSYTVMHNMPDKILLSPRLISETVNIFREMEMFNQFLNRGVAEL